MANSVESTDSSSFKAYYEENTKQHNFTLSKQSLGEFNFEWLLPVSANSFCDEIRFCENWFSESLFGESHFCEKL
jgi:hypothetical protein